MTEPTTNEKNWVWYSTVESAAEGKISVLAVTETLLLTAAGLYAWLYHGWFWHLLFGLVVAPLFYLRTEVSTKTALEWGRTVLDFFFDDGQLSCTNHRGWFLGGWLGLAIFSSLLVVWPLWTAGVGPFWIGGVVGVISIGIILFGAAIVDNVAGVAVVVGVSAVAVTVAGFVAGIIAVVGVVVGAFVVVVLGRVTRTLVVIPTMPGLAWIVFLMLSVTRIGAATWCFIRAPLSSLRRMTENWRHHHFAFDSVHPPEILPNAERNGFELCFSRLKKDFKRGIADRIGKTIFLVTLFLPAFLFRYSMKAGAWLWLPLVWLLQAHDTKDDDAFLRAESTEFLAHLKLIYALFILVVLTFGALVMASWLAQQGWQEAALGMIFLFGFAKLWTWTRAVTAALYLVSYLWSRSIRIGRETRGEPEYGAGSVAVLRYLFRIRGVTALFTMLVSIYLVATQMIDWSLVAAAMDELQLLPGSPL